MKLTTIAAALLASAALFGQVQWAPPNPYGQAATNLPPLPATVTQPKLPASMTPPPFPAALQTTQVSNTADLVNALAALQCGNAIEVMAGTYVTTSTPTVDLQCPASSMALIYGEGLTLASSTKNIGRTASLPSIQTANGNAVFAIANGASGIYVAGINFTTVTPLPVGVYPLVVMCDNDCTDESEVPSNIWFDRVQITAPNPPAASGPFVQRGLQPNCTNCGVINSAVWNIAAAGLDAQAILISNTPGPVLVWNNDLESSGENLMLNTLGCQTGYCGYGLTDMPAPSAIVAGNHFDKQFAWENGWLGCVQGGEPECPTVKDEFEIKHGQYVLVDHNHFENDFAQAQAEFNIVNCFATGPYICNDIQFSSNYYAHGPTGIEISANGTAQTGQRILVRNNYMADINGAVYTVTGTSGEGIFFSMNNCVDCTVDHNTALNLPANNNPWAGTVGNLAGSPNFTYTNNIAYGGLEAPPNYGGGVEAGLVNATWGADYFVGDTWPTSCVGCSYKTPLYPAGITVIDSSLTPPNTGAGYANCPCNFAAYWPVPGVEVMKSVPLCWSDDWQGIEMYDFADASTGKYPLGAVISPASPLFLQATDRYSNPGANIWLVTWYAIMATPQVH